jgi:uncharacterized membrane protein YGL010W
MIKIPVLEDMFKERSIESWIEEYEASHQHPVNRAFHYLGIPLIAFSLPLFLAVPFAPRFWKVPAFLFLLGWAFQLAGHAVEGRPPEFLKDRRFLLVGLRWWLSRVLPRR